MPRERTHLRYQLYRSRARQLAATSAAQLQDGRTGSTGIDLSHVRFEAINAQVLEACERWEDPHFLWDEVIGWKAKEPLSLDIAISTAAELSANQRRFLQILVEGGIEGEPDVLPGRR